MLANRCELAQTTDHLIPDGRRLDHWIGRMQNCTTMDHLESLGQVIKSHEFNEGRLRVLRLLFPYYKRKVDKT